MSTGGAAIGRYLLPAGHSSKPAARCSIDGTDERTPHRYIDPCEQCQLYNSQSLTQFISQAINQNINNNVQTFSQVCLLRVNMLSESSVVIFKAILLPAIRY